MLRLVVVSLAVGGLAMTGCSSGAGTGATENAATTPDPVQSAQGKGRNLIDTVSVLDADIANDARGLEPYVSGDDDDNSWLVGQYAERGGYDQGAIYLMKESGSLTKVVDGISPGSFAVVGKDVYVTIPNEGTVNQLDVKTGKLTQLLPAPGASSTGQSSAPGCPDSATGADVSFSWPWGLAVSGESLYIADVNHNCVRSVSIKALRKPGSAKVERVIGLADGSGGYNGTGKAPDQTQLHAPGGLDFDSQGDLFVADTLNQVVWELDIRKGADRMKLVAGVPGQAGFNGDGQPATKAQLNYPWGVDIDKQNLLFIADQRNNRVRYVKGGNIGTLAGTGTAGNSGDGGPAQQAELAYPWDVANMLDDDAPNKSLFVDALYFSDSGNHSIRVIGDRDNPDDEASGSNPPTSGNQTAPTWPPTS